MDSDSNTLAGGFPHSEIFGSKFARNSPKLIAACHVLHRLSVPRHPPDALLRRLISLPRAGTKGPRDGARRKLRHTRAKAESLHPAATRMCSDERIDRHGSRSSCDGQPRSPEVSFTLKPYSLCPTPPPGFRPANPCLHTSDPAGSLFRGDSWGRQLWWAREDLNLRPHAYQARALTS